MLTEFYTLYITEQDKMPPDLKAIETLLTVHTMNMKKHILIFLALLPAMLWAQEQHWRDTTYMRGGYAIHLRHLADSTLSEQLTRKSEQIEAPSEAGVLCDEELIKVSLRKKVKLHYNTYRWDATYQYLSAITCRNGLKLIFPDGITHESYSPRSNTIVVRNCGIRQTYDLHTGEDGYEYSADIPGQDLRVVGETISDDDDAQRLYLQKFNRETNRYETIFAISQEVDQNFYYNNYLLHRGALYLYSESTGDWWKLIFEKQKKGR